MNRIVRAVLVIGMLLSVSGCGPRGEADTLPEIYKRSQDRFEQSMKKAQVTDAVKPLVSRVAEGVQNLMGDGSAKAAAPQLAEALSACGDKAGPTSRQPLYELTMQLRALGEGANEPTGPQRMLIAARVLDAMSAELETVAFRYTQAG